MRGLVAVAVLVLAAACAPSGGTDSTVSGGADAGTEGGQTALAWSVPKLGGGQIEGGDLEGKDVVLWFWAPW